MGVSTLVVHIVDDDASLRTALERLLGEAGYTAKGYASAGDFLLAAPHAPGCIVLDLSMPGPSGLDLQEGLARAGDKLPIVFLTGHGDVPHSVRAMKAGAVDFLQKPVESATLFRAINTALERGTVQRAQVENAHVLRERYATLTPRERDIFAHVVAGRLNKQIGYDLNLAERTVKLARASLVAKMQLKTVPEMVRAADMLKAVGVFAAATRPWR